LRRELIVAGSLLVACAKPAPQASPEDAAPPPPRGTFTIIGTPPPPPDASTDESTPYRDSIPVKGKSIGHTSVVFKLELANGKKLAFKPHSKKGPHRYKGEIAAYALGRELGIPNVPPAYGRSFPVKELEKALAGDETATKLFTEQVIVEDGIVRGAVIPWIDKLEFIPFEKDPWWTKWRGWLKKDAAIPDEQKDLARQASVLVCFDYVTANWDRFSGANVGFDKEKNLLLFMDNDGAFFERPPKDGVERNKALLRGIDRFSKRFVAALRATKEKDLATIFEARVASDAVRQAARGRIGEVLDHVDAKIAANGEDATLFFE
jgi:hypothetical protein